MTDDPLIQPSAGFEFGIGWFETDPDLLSTHLVGKVMMWFEPTPLTIFVPEHMDERHIDTATKILAPYEPTFVYYRDDDITHRVFIARTGHFIRLGATT